ncbi:MAG: alpha/beta fold hydrolase [Candidatus Kerfeldbacteria bacterium]|nr:alpha/beta fold hydrolase [Candidatus Kerfeldbacteria bacterium]
MVASIETAAPRRDRTASAAQSFFLRGGRTGLLLLHGFAGSIADLRQLGQALNQRGYTVLGTRLAGHGTSIDDLHRTVAEDWIAAARTALHSLAGQVDRLVIVAESMGGLVALRLAREHQRVFGLVLLAPAVALKHERVRAAASQFLPAKLKWRKPWSTPAREQRGSLPAVTAAAYRQLMRLLRAERSRLSQIRVPILALFARQDFVTDRRAREVLERRVPEALLTVETLDAVTHHLGETAALPHVVTVVDRFIQQQTR